MVAIFFIRLVTECIIAKVKRIMKTNSHGKDCIEVVGTVRDHEISGERISGPHCNWFQTVQIP